MERRRYENNWLSLKLIGNSAEKTPKDPIISTVFVSTGKLRQRYELISGASYASQNDQVIQIGLGNAAKIEALEIIWANGETQKVSVDKLNQQMIIRQGDLADPIKNNFNSKV